MYYLNRRITEEDRSVDVCVHIRVRLWFNIPLKWFLSLKLQKYTRESWPALISNVFSSLVCQWCVCFMYAAVCVGNGCGVIHFSFRFLICPRINDTVFLYGFKGLQGKNRKPLWQRLRLADSDCWVSRVANNFALAPTCRRWQSNLPFFCSFDHWFRPWAKISRIASIQLSSFIVKSGNGKKINSILPWGAIAWLHHSECVAWDWNEIVYEQIWLDLRTPYPFIHARSNACTEMPTYSGPYTSHNFFPYMSIAHTRTHRCAIRVCLKGICLFCVNVCLMRTIGAISRSSFVV